MNRRTAEFYVGTAGWGIPAELREDFPGKGTILERYSGLFKAVEINSSFYRDHMAKTYARWASVVPEGFRFSIKLSRRFTHEKRLKVPLTELKKLFAEVSELGHKLGCFLVQLPPSLKFDAGLAETFFANFRRIFNGDIVIEPRHSSWSDNTAKKIFKEYQVGRVYADPAPFQAQLSNSIYYRLHGSPQIYKSAYTAKQLEDYADRIEKRNCAWCIFDNTVLGHATANALEFQSLLDKRAETLAKRLPS